MPRTLKERWKMKEEALGYQSFLKADLIKYKGTFLPRSAAPFVSFSEAEGKHPQGDCYGGALDPEVFTLIGSDGSGNPICEELSTGKVYLLDHDNSFNIDSFVNSSVALLAECLLAFLGEHDPKEAAQKITAIDPEATKDGTFWNASIRDLEDGV
jgi:hypothetical protein